MKNLKKVLAMVLAFACTFTMFASAKMYEDVQPGTEFSEAITMLSDLGIIQGKTDNKYHPEDTITRAEACALIARLMTGDPNAAGFNGAHHFKDVPAGFWASSAIGYCVVNGIAIGVDEAGTRFEPQRPIKDKEFVTMIVRALGYETPDMRNNFPFGYMSAARAIGLLQDVNMVPDTDALRGEDAQVIYNAMFVDYARGAKRVNVAHGTSVESYPTLAESVWHLNRAALGTWNKKDNEDVTLSNCKAHNWVILGAAQDEENSLLALAIDDNEDTDLYKAEEKKHEYKAYKFKYEGTADIDALRGYKVELWGAGKHGEPVWEKDGDKFVYSNDWKIKAIKTVKGQTKFDYNASMADKKDHDGEIQIDEETKLKLESAADNAKLVKQEQGVKEVVTFAADELNTIKVKNDEALEQALNVRNGMQYKLMDWNGDKEIDWVVVDEARYYKVESATSKRIVVSSMEGDNLKSDKDSKVETWKIDDSEKIGKNLAGKDVKIKYEAPEGLKEGDIVEVTYKVTYEDKAQLITATVKVVDADNQKLEKVATKDGLTLTFGDKELKVAQNARKDGGDVIVPANPEKYAGFNGEELGTEFALYKNRNDFIVYSDYATKSSNYMMVLDTEGGKDQTGNRDLAVIDFVDAANAVHNDVKIASDLRLLDKDGKSISEAYDKRKFNEEKVVGNVFKYWTDADGVITKMQAVFTEEDAKEATSKEGYNYKADADRLVNKDGKYVASLADANVIFAVKPDYIQQDKQVRGSVVINGTQDLEVDSNDVLATKQSDIPDIDKDPQSAELLRDGLGLHQERSTWLGSNLKNDNHFVVNVNKNAEATAAILGVDSFNKFNAGQTKLALVTNVSEDSKGVIEAEVAYDGKVEKVASVEKQDFSDIVKVFDGTEDQDVSATDAVISAANNGVFHNEKLSEVVNEGGQYAEITMDKDGKLTKIVFMDDVAGNRNLMRGHHYEVSRNLVLDANEKNLKYGLNDNKRYDDVVSDQRFAADDKLFSTGRLEADTKSYADDAKFYEIAANPSRHDKDYTGTRLTVNAGFDDLDQRDIKVVEKSDIDYNAPDYRADKNHYEVADLASKIDGDLVAVYSFKSMDEKYTEDLVGLELNKTNAKVGEPIQVNATVLHTKNNVHVVGLKVFDEHGTDVTKELFTTSNESGYGDVEYSGTVTPKTDRVMNGKYVVKVVVTNAKGETVVVDAGREFTVSDAADYVQVHHIAFGKSSGTGYAESTTFNRVGRDGFILHVEGRTKNNEKARIDDVINVLNLNKSNLKITLDGQEASIITFENLKDGYYEIHLGVLEQTKEKVDFINVHNNSKLVVELKKENNLVLPANGIKPLSVITDGTSTSTGGNQTDTTAPTTSVEGVKNVHTVRGTQVNGDTPVADVEVNITTANGVAVTKLATDADTTTKNFAVQLDGKLVAAEKVTVTESPVGTYKIAITGESDLRGHTVKVTIHNGKTPEAFDEIVVPTATVSFELSDKGVVTASKGDKLDGKKVTVQNEQNTDGLTLKVWQAGTTYAKATTKAFDKSANIVAQVSGKDINLTGTIKADAPKSVEFIVGYSDTAKKVLTVDINDATVAELKNTEATGKTAGVKGVTEVKAAATFAITKGTDGNFKLKIGDGNETADIAAATDNNTTASNAKTQLETTYGSKYNFTISKNKITIEAKTMTDGETIPALTVVTGGETHATVGTAEDPKTGAPAVTKVLGKVDFVIKATANAGDAGDWEVKIAGDQMTETKFDVTITDGMTPSQIAEAIKNAVTDAKLEAEVTGNTVTIKEKDANAGEFFKDADFTATFAPKA